jgi:AcrR family transcriptional regulator
MSAMRKQRARGTFTREQVVSAALAVADRVGVERLTIRRVANMIDAPPMSLYSHFSNKHQLLDLMYAEISRQMYQDSGNERWQDELLSLAARIRSLLHEHPHWAALLSRPAEPIAVPLRERILRQMTADGMSVQESFEALSSVVLLTIGLVLVELELRTPDGQSMLEARFDKLKTSMEHSGDEVTRQALARIERFDLTAMHDFALRVLVEGLNARCGSRRRDS